MSNPFADDRIDAIDSTDCVSEEIIADNRLRFARATSAIRFLFLLGALDGRTGASQDPLARITTSNADPIGRARNRHVRLTVSKVTPEKPEPTPDKKEKPSGQRPVPRGPTSSQPVSVRAPAIRT